MRAVPPAERREPIGGLTVLLVETGTLHAVRLKRKSVKQKKKIVAAVYEYQANCDGEWGEIHFDFISNTVKIVRLVEWDTIVNKVFAEQTITHIRFCDMKHKIQKFLLVPCHFESPPQQSGYRLRLT